MAGRLGQSAALMSPYPIRIPVVDASRAVLRTVLAVALLLPCPAGRAVEFELVDAVAPRPAAADERPRETGGMFLPSDNGSRLWKQTLATVSADWPIVRTVEPDFRSVPPREGLIESAWLEPPASEFSSSDGSE